MEEKNHRDKLTQPQRPEEHQGYKYMQKGVPEGAEAKRLKGCLMK